MCEVDRCTECGSNNILYDEKSGEAVCIACGLVLEIVEYTAPADRVTKSVPRSPIAYTSGSVGTEIDSYQRLELNVAFDIERVVQQLNLPKATELLANNYVQRLRRSMRQQNDPKIRFTRTALTALSVWTALKQLKYPLSCNEFSQKIQPLIGSVNLMKMEKRACHFIDKELFVFSLVYVVLRFSSTIKSGLTHVAHFENLHFAQQLFVPFLNQFTKIIRRRFNRPPKFNTPCFRSGDTFSLTLTDSR